MTTTNSTCPLSETSVTPPKYRHDPETGQAATDQLEPRRDE